MSFTTNYLLYLLRDLCDKERRLSLKLKLKVPEKFSQTFFLDFEYGKHIYFTICPSLRSKSVINIKEIHFDNYPFSIEQFSFVHG